MSKKRSGGRPTPARTRAITSSRAVGDLSHDCDPLAQLRQGRAHQLEIETRITWFVMHARMEHNVPWEAIAEALGVTRQAASKKYGDVVAEAIAMSEGSNDDG